LPRRKAEACYRGGLIVSRTAMGAISTCSAPPLASRSTVRRHRKQHADHKKRRPLVVATHAGERAGARCDQPEHLDHECGYARVHVRGSTMEPQATPSAARTPDTWLML
jgi:hypothetical protein